MSYTRQDFGNALIIGGFLTILMEAAWSLIKFIRYHPFISLAFVVVVLIGQALYAAFGLDVVNVRKYENMTEIEIGRELEATECRPEGATMYCEYDFGETKIWYNTQSKPVRMEMEAAMERGIFEMDTKFYSYALHRIGIEEYHEPNVANIDRIVWTNANGIGAMLESNQSLTPVRWTIVFNSNVGT